MVDNLGVVLAGPRDATAFLVCRTPCLGCGLGVGVPTVPSGIVAANSGGMVLLRSWA